MSTSETQPVRYQEHDGRDGLVIAEGALFAYRNGVAVDSVPVDMDTNLRQLMLDYQVISLLPDVEFCHTAPEEFAVSIVLDPFHLPGEITGKVDINGEQHLWVAQPNLHPDFRLADSVPDAFRPYIKPDGRGFEYFLPAAIQTHPDPLVPRRLAVALDGFLCALANDRNITNPFRAAFTNVFSAARPAWRINLPRVISVDQRAV